MLAYMYSITAAISVATNGELNSRFGATSELMQLQPLASFQGFASKEKIVAKVHDPDSLTDLLTVADLEESGRDYQQVGQIFIRQALDELDARSINGVVNRDVHNTKDETNTIKVLPLHKEMEKTELKDGDLDVEARSDSEDSVDDRPNELENEQKLELHDYGRNGAKIQSDESRLEEYKPEYAPDYHDENFEGPDDKLLGFFTDEETKDLEASQAVFPILATQQLIPSEVNVKESLEEADAVLDEDSGILSGATNIAFSGQSAKTSEKYRIIGSAAGGLGAVASTLYCCVVRRRFKKLTHEELPIYGSGSERNDILPDGLGRRGLLSSTFHISIVLLRESR